MIILASVVAGCLVLGILVGILLRVSQSSMQSGFTILRDNFESLQRNILLLQKESERSQDQKSVALRSELAMEMQTSRKEIQQGLTQTTSLLEQKVQGIDQKLDSRLNSLTQGVQIRLDQNMKEGFVHFEKVQLHLKQAEAQLTNLNAVGQSINELNSLLKLPHLRGNFGEAVLERLLTDLLPSDSFELQYRVVPNSTERVDAVIKYPNQVLPIDSKFPREQVLPIFETSDPDKLESARKQLSDVMRGLARQIKEKYIHPEHGTADMALLFVPSETLYIEIIRNVKLCEDLGKLKVFAVSPNTLCVTLHAISISRNYYEMARGVEKTITEVKKARQHFENFDRKFEEIGSGLNKAQQAYNTATTHLTRYSSAVTRLTGVEAANELLPGVPSPEVTA